MCLFELKRYREGLPFFLRALRHEPGHPVFRLGAARGWKREGKVRGARLAYLKLLHDDPRGGDLVEEYEEFARAHFAKATVDSDLRRITDLRRVTASASRQDPRQTATPVPGQPPLPSSGTFTDRGPRDGRLPPARRHSFPGSPGALRSRTPRR